MFLLSAASKSSAACYCCELQTMQDNALSVALMHESIYPMWVYIAYSSSNKRKREETHSCARLAKKESHTTKQTWRPVERKREKTFINLAKYRNKGKKLNSFLSEAGEKSFQLANQPRKKGQGDSSNWHFVLTPFATQKFVPEKKATPITENTERGQKPQNRLRNKSFLISKIKCCLPVHKIAKYKVWGMEKEFGAGVQRKAKHLIAGASNEFSNPTVRLSLSHTRARHNKQHSTSTAAKIIFYKEKKSQQAAKKSIEINFINIGQLFL